MQKEHTELTPSQENYLLSVRSCSLERPARLSELAEMNEVKMPSATRAVGNLARAGLVMHEPYGGVTLSPEGKRVADGLDRRRECVARLLVEVLGLSPESADKAAHRIEHALDDDVLNGLETLVDFAVTSPGWIRRLQHRIATRLATGGENN